MANQFNILDYTNGPQLKTGQTIDNTPPGRTTKDDGGFQFGIAGSKADNQYIILTTGQYAGTTNITVNAIVDAHTNACVFDKVTGLLWNREVTPAIYGAGAENLLWDDTAGADEDIFKYCDQANLSNLSGFSDWRVPNILELHSLIIISSNVAAPRINNTAFPIFTTSDVLSSTTQSNSNASALALNFTTSRIVGNMKTSARDVGVLVRLGM